MHSFVDRNGQTWSLVVNIGAVKRVRALCNGLNLLELVNVDENGKTDSKLLDSLSENPVLLVDVLYAICKPEADKLNVSDEKFGDSMNGDSIEVATHALLDEIVDFFPESKRRVFQKMLNATRRFQEAGKKKLQEFVDSPAFDQLVESRIKSLNSIGSNVQESSE